MTLNEPKANHILYFPKYKTDFKLLINQKICLNYFHVKVANEIDKTILMYFSIRNQED